MSMARCRAEAEARLAGVDYILRAGDIGAPEIVPRLQRLAPTTAIRGNVDGGPLGGRVSAPCAGDTGRSGALLHDLAALDVDPVAAGLAMIVSGHSHRPGAEVREDVVSLHPGTAGPRRFRLPVTFATVDLGERLLAPVIHTLVL